MDDFRELSEVDKIKNDFIIAHAENDELAMFFIMQRMIKTFSDGTLTKEEIRELFTFVGGKISTGVKTYELQ